MTTFLEIHHFEFRTPHSEFKAHADRLPEHPSFRERVNNPRWHLMPTNKLTLVPPFRIPNPGAPGPDGFEFRISSERQLLDGWRSFTRARSAEGEVVPLVDGRHSRLVNCSPFGELVKEFF